MANFFKTSYTKTTVMKQIISLLLGTCVMIAATAQETKAWSETDQKYLIQNLTRSRDQLVQATENLTEAQWNFKESADRWSIKEIIEHIALWELLFQREISQALSAGPQPDLAKAAKQDSVYLSFIMETKPHVSVEYTKPFTFSLPMGLNTGANNVAWFLKMRNESITYLTGAKEDLRAHFLKPGRPNVHQVYINTFGHADRHLRQVMKIKQHPKYPK
jgi:hypothetical protein